MALSAEEIERKQFLVGLRGYDRDEVAAFLRATAGEVRRLHEEVARASTRPVDAAASVGDQVAAVLRTAQEASDALRIEAERTLAERLIEAEGVVQAAREEARVIIASAEHRVEATIAKATERYEAVRRAELELVRRLGEAQDLLQTTREEMATECLRIALEPAWTLDVAEAEGLVSSALAS